MKLILASISFILGSIAIFNLYTNVFLYEDSDLREQRLMYIPILLLAVCGLTSVLYHIKTFNLLDSNKLQINNKSKYLPKALWIGPYGISICFISFAFYGVYALSIQTRSYVFSAIIIILSSLLLGYWNVFEAWNMRKQYLNSIRPNEDDIDEIGSR
ncbi:MAG: hypothetical protein ACPGYY_08640 [Bacteroidia bacterium]